MELYENMILQYLLEDDKKIRIIFIDKPRGYCYTVNLEGNTAMPQLRDIDSIIEQIESEELILTSEPYAQVFNDEEIPDKYILIRDRYWSIIEYLWDENKMNFLDKNKRSEVISLASQKYKESEKKIRRLITRFFQRGMKKNALLFDYRNSGGKGKPKKYSNKKRGRQRNPEKSGEIIEGINVDEVTLNIIKISINMFYLKKEKKSLAESYKYMLRKFYSDRKMLNNIMGIYVRDKSRIPSYRQFVYWYHKLEDTKETIFKRDSEINFQLHNRALQSNSTIGAWGPGSRYQIDATVADVYLVSTSDRKRLIGRPIVYGVIDVLSRLVAGIYVGLEGPSWIGAMMAIDNVIEDKVEFCLRYGIKITSEKWPNSYLPEKILADRGEFEGYNVENLINNLNIRIENTAPYRGDLKGIVERYFRTTNEKIKHMTPGAIEKEFRERGDRDYRLDAVLNIEEFTSIIIHEVIEHNNSIIHDYPMNIEMIKDEVPSVPKDIWNWGLKNRRCAFKYVEKDIARLNLMYRKTVSISRRGIRFKHDMFYGCDIAIKEQWYLKRIKEKLDIVFDPRNMNYIYIPINNGTDFIKCHLLEKSLKYKDLSLEEVTFIQELEEETISAYTDIQNQINVNFIESTEGIIKNAKKETELSVGESDGKRIKNIRKNRSEEKDNIRNTEGFELDKSRKENIPKKAQDCGKNNQFEEDNGSSSKMNLFRQIRGEKVGK